SGYARASDCLREIALRPALKKNGATPAEEGRRPANLAPSPRSARACSAYYLLNCTQRPSVSGEPAGAPLDWVRTSEIQGLPPTPPRTGCFGKLATWVAWSRSITTSVPTSALCGPPTGLSLLRKIIRHLRPDSSDREPPSVMVGPGLFSQLVT